jgi:D-aminoacyl-tRNA deacylase
MRIVLQRVKQGSVSIEDRQVAAIGLGLVLLVGIGPEDDEVRMKEMAEKVAFLRIFEDDQGKMNRSILEVGGAAIVVSQFTLYADTRKGRRPSFTGAGAPEMAKPLVDRFAAFLAAWGIPVQTGEFGADMMVEIYNDGPVTILLEA